MSGPGLSPLEQQAIQLHKSGNIPAAEQLYQQILLGNPASFVAGHSLGLIRFQQGRNDEALALIGGALKVQPNSVAALANYGLALQEGGRGEEALKNFDKALALSPGHPQLLFNRGVALWNLKRWDAALASYDQALAAAPDFVPAWNNRGNVLKEMGRTADALASFERALALQPNFAEAHYNRGNMLAELKRFDEALAAYDRVLAIQPRHVGALVNRGNVLRQLRRFTAALDSFDHALAAQPGHVSALNNRGNSLYDLKRFDEALRNYEEALTRGPDNALALANRAGTLRQLKRLDEAVVDFERALKLDPGNAAAHAGLLQSVLHLCDWKRSEKLVADIGAHLSDGEVGPLVLLWCSDDPAQQLECARSWIATHAPAPVAPLWTGGPRRPGKIRIAYISADYHRHATALLMAGLFERHDRGKFEVTAISFGPDDGSDMQARVRQAFDAFYDVRERSDLEVAQLLRRLDIDIAIDLKGHTTDARPEILKYRACPVQVNYLGYPGTLGGDYIDYIIGDSTILPPDMDAYFSEKIVRLPGCYLVNDDRRGLGDAAPSRMEAGLPETGFVFCCFNNHWKINRPVFEIWMRLLAAVPGSVLWLIDESEASARNLRAEAKGHGIDPARLIFAPKKELAAHIGRHRLADLFLDTLPYNAHTTACDCLWAGVPMITCPGKTFAARVGASTLLAAGMPELVTQSLEAYEALALKLARDPALLKTYRDRLAANRTTCALFDTDLFRRRIEAAYERMLQIYDGGQKPRAFEIAAG